MQISSNHSGFNFSSVYKSVITRHDPQQKADQFPAAPLDGQLTESARQSARLHHETLILQAAHRVAERSADVLSATPEL